MVKHLRPLQSSSSTAQPKKEAAINTKKLNYDVTGDLLDKACVYASMQEKSDKIMIELENKRTRFEERQMEIEA